MNDFLVLMIFLLQLIEVLIILSLIGDVQDIRADLYYYTEIKGDSEDICLSYISEDGADPMTTKQVFIEPCDFCQKCQFYDDGHCRVYDKNCEDVIECFQFNERM